MGLAGFLLLISGWLLSIAALVLLRPEAFRAGFVLAAVAVEALGLVLLARSRRSRGREA